MIEGPFKPKKVIVLSGRRTDPAYDVRIQIVQHPVEQDFKRTIAVHRFPFSEIAEVACLSMFRSRCPICDAVSLAGEPFQKWNVGRKKYVFFYGLCLNERFEQAQVSVKAGELVLWMMIENDFKSIDQVINQRRFAANRMTNYTFDIRMNPQADFRKRESRCTTNFSAESADNTASIFNEETPPLSRLLYSSVHPTDDELEKVIEAYCRIPMGITNGPRP